MNGNDMNRFFHECFHDPALGAVIAVALIIVVVMTWLVVRDKLQQRRVQERLHRKRGQIKEKRAKAIQPAEGPN